MTDGRVAVVTGANRGIGFEVARQLGERGLTVALGSRDPDRGKAAAASLAGHGARVVARRLDVTNQQDVDELSAWLRAEFGGLDILVNNAAGFYDTWQRGVDADLTTAAQALDVNVLGAWRMCRASIPLMRSRGGGRIVNVSSELGALNRMGGGTPAYSVSKAALNALTLILAAELRSERILVNAVSPGWVATDMGGPGGRPVAEGAAGVVWAALLPDGGPTGGFFRDGRRLDW